MSRKAILGLAIVTVIVLVAAMFAVNQREAATRRQVAGDLLFPDLIDAANDVVSVRIDGGDAPIRIEQKGDGWVVATKDDYPAVFERIKPVILALAEARTIAAKTAKPERFADLGLADPGSGRRGATQVTVSGEGGTELASLLVGDSGLGGGAKHYVRRAGENQTWLTDIDITLPTTALGWLDPGIARLGSSKIWRATVTQPDAAVIALAKLDRASGRVRLDDIPEGKKPKEPGQLTAVIDVLARLDMTDVRTAGDLPFGQNEQTVSVYEAFDGLVVTARSIEFEDAVWVVLEARHDSAVADAAPKAPEPDPAEEGSAEEGLADDDPDSADSGDDADLVRAEVDALNRTWSGWAYAIADYAGDQMRADADTVLDSVAPVAPEEGPSSLDPQTLQGFEELIEESIPPQN